MTSLFPLFEVSSNWWRERRAALRSLLHSMHKIQSLVEGNRFQFGLLQIFLHFIQNSISLLSRFFHLPVRHLNCIQSLKRGVLFPDIVRDRVHVRQEVQIFKLVQNRTFRAHEQKKHIEELSCLQQLPPLFL